MLPHLASRLPLLVLSAFVLGTAYWRLFYGVDLTDEPLYIVVPLRFAQGAQPFVDEVSITHTTAGLLMTPLVYAYHALFGVEGILLLEDVEFVLSLLVAATLFVAVRSFIVWRPAAFIVSLFPVVCVGTNLPSLSYNTLGRGRFCGWLLSGIGILSLREEGRGNRVLVLLSGFCHGIAALAYPPLLAPILAYLAIRLYCNRRSWQSEATHYGLPAIAFPVVALGALAINVGVEHVSADYRNQSAFIGKVAER